MGSRDRTNSSQNKKRLRIVLMITTAYMIVEVVGGVVTGSLALLADAGHMLTDVGGLALAIVAMTFAERPANPERTYGYYRIEILAAAINAVILLGISGGVLYEAYGRFRDPPRVSSTPMLLVAGIGLVVNVVGVRLLRTDSDASLNVKGAYFEVLSDLLTSAGVIVAGVVMLATGWYYADPLVSVGIGLLIVPRTWRLLSEAVGILLEGTPVSVNLSMLRSCMNALAGVSSVHDLHVWSITSGMYAMSAHVVAAKGARSNVLLDAIRSVAHEFQIEHVTIQIESEPCGDEKLHA